MHVAGLVLLLLFGNINSAHGLLDVLETIIEEVIDFIGGVINIFTSVSHDVLETMKDHVVGVISGAINMIPSMSQLGDLVKQMILGVPSDLVLESIDVMCSLDASEGKLNSYYKPNISQIKFQFRSQCNVYSYHLSEAQNIINNTEFDVNKKIVVFVTGWTTAVNDSSINGIGLVTKAYTCRGDYNFLKFDNSDYLQITYTSAAVNTQLLGQYLGVGLENLAKVVPYENIHLVGHSLGAHLVGIAGRHFTNLTGNKLQHITGLDPANPCFNEGQQLGGIFRGDAEFVDIIHTTPGSVGVMSPIGDIDFYAGGFRPLKPGCDDVACGHKRAVQYYAESVYPNNENNFMSKRCSSLVALRSGFCSDEEIPMGFAAPHDAVGFYFLELNAEEPFGTNATEDFQSTLSPCGNCPSQK